MLYCQLRELSSQAFDGYERIIVECFTDEFAEGDLIARKIPVS